METYLILPPETAQTIQNIAPREPVYERAQDNLFFSFVLFGMFFIYFHSYVHSITYIAFICIVDRKALHILLVYVSVPTLFAMLLFFKFSKLAVLPLQSVRLVAKTDPAKFR